MLTAWPLKTEGTKGTKIKTQVGDKLEVVLFVKEVDFGRNGKQDKLRKKQIKGKWK